MFLTSWFSFFRFVLMVVVVLGLVVPFFIQLVLLIQPTELKDDLVSDFRSIQYINLYEKQKEIHSMKLQLKELDNIKLKTLNYLRLLDENRVSLIEQVSLLVNHKDMLEKEVKKLTNQLSSRSKKEPESIKMSEQVMTKTIYVGVPLNSYIDSDKHHMNRSNCNLDKCFDFSKCSYVDKFSIYLYEPRYKEPLYKHFISLIDLVKDNNSCIYLVFLNMNDSVKSLNAQIEALSTWKSTGANHILYLQHFKNENYCNKVDKLNVKQSVKVMSFSCDSAINYFDFVIPSVDLNSLSQVAFSNLMPLNRKFILSFYKQSYKNNKIQDLIVDQIKHESDVVIINSSQISKTCLHNYCSFDNPSVMQLLKDSQFTILLHSNRYFVDELWYSLYNGAIPVVLGNKDFLPFSDVLDWKKAAVLLPVQRLTELIFILRTFHVDDISAMKAHGRFLFETYFSDHYKVLRTVLEVFKHRIGVLPTPEKDFQVKQFLHIAKQPDDTVINSVNFLKNFSFLSRSSYKSWNSYPGGLTFFPVTPWSNPPPSLYQFSKEGREHFMPIADGKGGDGVSFSRSLGGDMPFEMFTVVMLTYDRYSILMEALQRLSGMKYLHKVVVVWNHPSDPTDDIVWPDIGVRVEVIRASGNSLNNRFIPYSNIETEAILSVDDDIYLRHDEIELAFRVWRENRNRLVGFPGRHHSYNATKDSFDYNSEHSCELSLVLTGGAFFHKYYSYVYTNHMASSIREMVDQYMNCEDIAMNFLVAHITQKPPIKVTSRWTFKCPGCPAALSADESHYFERNSCMTYFEQVFGYNPLKRTQYRADSILFKTRLPSGLTKCFQYV
ncbi:exostosin-like 3 [Hydra vulgaris]|nr:exostosin-like 3 [Hydra vulgaris]